MTTFDVHCASVSRLAVDGKNNFKHLNDDAKLDADDRKTNHHFCVRKKKNQSPPRRRIKYIVSITRKILFGGIVVLGILSFHLPYPQSIMRLCFPLLLLVAICLQSNFAFLLRSTALDPSRTTTTAVRRHVAIVNKEDLQPSRAESSKKDSPLSLRMDELTRILGGRGRARIVWEHLRRGLDPWDGSSLLLGPDQRVPFEASEEEREESPVLGTCARKLYEKHFSTSLIQSIGSLVQTTRASDGTTKLLLQLARDNLQVETVIIPWDDRRKSTLCVSSQVGCKQGCTFCLTGKMGKLRSLTTNEILFQVAVANALCQSKHIYPIDNIVFMGKNIVAQLVKYSAISRLYFFILLPSSQEWESLPMQAKRLYQPPTF